MKRKIVKHGLSTLTISLPRKWVKNNDITQGDELDITAKGSNLIISSKLKQRKLEIELNLSNSDNMLARTIAAVYKAGYDKLSITYNDSKELEIIQDTIYRYCHVYEIVEITRNKVEIRSLSQLDPSHFEDMLEKSAKSILSVAQETYNAIISEDYKALSNIILKDKIIDRYTAYGSRIINRGYSLNHTHIGPLYLIFDETEIAADIFKVICKEMITKKLKLSQNQQTFFKEIVEFMGKQYDLLLNFDYDKVKYIGQLEKKIRKHIDELCQIEKNNILILAYLINLFETVFEMKNAIMTMHYGENMEK